MSDSPWLLSLRFIYERWGSSSREAQVNEGHETCSHGSTVIAKIFFAVPLLRTKKLYCRHFLIWVVYQFGLYVKMKVNSNRNLPANTLFGTFTLSVNLSFASFLTSVSIIVLIVLASLCAVLGAIYAYIYYTRINPRSARAKRFIERGQSQDAEDPEKATHTHLLLFRK